MTFTPITPGCCNRQDSGTVFLLAGCKQMRCIKINMVYLPMHHFLNVSGFPCFSLPHFILLFSLSHFERTVRDPIRCHPWSPVPGPQGSPVCYMQPLEATFPRGQRCCSCCRVWMEPKVFIFGKVLCFTCTYQKCVCVLILFCKGEVCIFI